jgi:hypothetical protein
VGCVRSKDDQACIWIVGHVSGVGRTYVYRLELAASPRFVLKSSHNLSVNLVSAGRKELFNEFARSSSYRGLRAIPVPRSLDVEVGGPIC